PRRREWVARTASTPPVSAIDPSGAGGPPRGGGRIASTPAGALEAVRRWTPHAAAVRAPLTRVSYWPTRRPATSAVADDALAASRAAEGIGEGRGPDLQARADERHGAVADVEAVRGDADLVASPRLLAPRDEARPARVAEPSGTRRPRARGEECAAGRRVEHDPRSVDEHDACGRPDVAGRQVERAAPHEALPAAGGRDAEAAHVDR